MTVGRRLVAASVVSLLAAGCGGGSGPSKEDVQTGVWQYVKDGAGLKVTVDDPECVKSGSVWRCLLDLHPSLSKTVHVEVNATCDKTRCLYELVSER